MKVSFRAMRNMGNAAKYIMFLNGKVRFWSVYVFFYKKENWGQK